MPGQLDRMADRLQLALAERDVARHERDLAHRELSSLRMSLRRVAELANQAGGALTIPDDDNRSSEGRRRGWNRLCAALCDWIEDKP